MTAGVASAADTYGVLLKNVRNPFWGVVEMGAKDADADLDDVDVLVVSGDSDANVVPQLNACQTMLQRDLKALIVAAVDNGLFPCLAEAISRGIPVFDIDSTMVRHEAAEAGIELGFSVGSNNYAAGHAAADYIGNRIESGKVLLIEGHPGSLPGIGRRDGFLARMKAVNRNIEVIGPLTANWDRNQAATVMTDALTANPDLVGVFAANDQMALGAVEALRASGRDDVMVVGVDGIADAVEAIMEGRLAASIAQLPYLFGYEGVMRAHKALMGDASGFNQTVPILALDKEVLEAKMERLLEFVK